MPLVLQDSRIDSTDDETMLEPQEGVDGDHFEDFADMSSPVEDKSP